MRAVLFAAATNRGQRMTDSTFDDRQAGTYHADAADAKTCAEFWDYLLAVEILGCADEEPTAPLHTAEVRDRAIKAFLAARRDKREQFWRRT